MGFLATYIMNIKQIICEEIYKFLDGHTILMEYAYKRKEYERDASARMQQILENWCLIHYVSLTGDKEVLKNHWKSELDTLIIDIQLKKQEKKSKINILRKVVGNFDYGPIKVCSTPLVLEPRN